MIANTLRYIILLIIISSFSIKLQGQELLANINIDTRQIQGTDKRVFETMRTAIYEFLNNRKWTNYQFEVDEKIECSWLIVIEQRNQGTNEYSGRLTVSSRRPVYSSSYTTTLFNYVDKDVKFKYIENEPLDYDQNTYTSDLTSLLGFYANIIIGLDFDSFTLNGGTPYFEAAQSIVNAAQNSIYPGWKSFDGQQNRFWLAENLMNSAYKKMHDFYYEYHINGLDIMHEDVDEGRRNILQSLQYLRDVRQSRPGLFLLQIFLEAKRDEIINVFTEGSTSEKSQAAEIMIEIDPSQTSRYRTITQE
jgi:hypothetical protein